MKIRINLTEAKKAVDPKKVAADKKAEAKKVADKKAADKKKAEDKKKADDKKKIKESLYPIVRQMLAENAVEEVKKEGIEEEAAAMEESVFADPNFWAGIGGLLLGSVPFVQMKYDQWKNAKTPEEKKKMEQELADAISKKMSGGM